MIILEHKLRYILTLQFLIAARLQSIGEAQVTDLAISSVEEFGKHGY
jgi:hypothetical protein